MKPNRIWTVWTAVASALLLAILFQVVFAAAIAFIELDRGVPTDELANAMMDRMALPWVMVTMMATGQLGIAISGIAATLMSPTPFRQRIDLLRPQPSWRVYPVAMLGSIAPLAVGLASAELVAKIIPPDDILLKFFDALTIDSAIVFVLFVGIAPAIFEEVLFRGYMQQRLVKRWGALAGILVTSIVFGLFHITPVAIAAAMPLGFWFGYITWRSKSILPAMLCHFFVNAGLNTWRMIVKFLEPSKFAEDAFYVSAIAVGVICFGIGCKTSFWRGKKLRGEI